MYLNYFGFSHKPFHITPDPDFLYLSPSHKEALAAIIYGIEEGMGFVAITGEVGTGKTIIIKSVLERIDRQQVSAIFIYNSFISFQELIDTILYELKIEPADQNIAKKVHQLQTYLIEHFANNKSFILIIDEAQNMPVETLEQLRMLSNIETAKNKLIQIILVGQPELDDKLNLPELRQLKQRLAIRATLHHLSATESLAYIKHRLSRVHVSSVESIFSSRALQKIIKYAKGNPRVINIVCENTLIACFGYQQDQVSLKIAKEVISDYEGSTRGHFLKWPSPIIAFGSLFLLGILIILGFSFLQTPSDNSSSSQLLVNRAEAISPKEPITTSDDTYSKKQVVLEEATLETKSIMTPATGNSDQLPASSSQLLISPVETSAPKKTIAATNDIYSRNPLVLKKTWLKANEKAIKQFFTTWTDAWQKSAGRRGNIDNYLSFYSESFKTDTMSKNDWQRYKAKLNRNKEWISVTMYELNIIPLSDESAEVNFIQSYMSSDYYDNTNKSIIIGKEQNGWKILAERENSHD